MKRILLACFLLTATCTVFTVQRASAQAVTQASFTVEVNALDSLIGINDMTDAQNMWNSIHSDMMTVLGVTKMTIATGGTVPGGGTSKAYMVNQRTIYSTIWGLHTDLLTNRIPIHTDLQQFDATIY